MKALYGAPTRATFVARAASSPRLPTPLNSPSCVYAQLKGSSTNPAAVNQRPTMLSGSGSGSDWPGKRKPRDDPCAPAPDRRSVASRKPRSIPDAWQSRGATVACYYALRRHAWEGVASMGHLPSSSSSSNQKGRLPVAPPWVIFLTRASSPPPFASSLDAVPPGPAPRARPAPPPDALGLPDGSSPLAVLPLGALLLAPGSPPGGIEMSRLV